MRLREREREGRGREGRGREREEGRGREREGGREEGREGGEREGGRERGGRERVIKCNYMYFSWFTFHVIKRIKTQNNLNHYKYLVDCDYLILVQIPIKTF